MYFIEYAKSLKVKYCIYFHYVVEDKTPLTHVALMHSSY